jgi:hypothetical protein
MSRIDQQFPDLEALHSAFQEIQKQLRYHTESGFTAEEANGYAQQLDDLEERLVPAWRKKLGDTPYTVMLECSPKLGGFLKIKINRKDAEPVVVFLESYVHFNSEMCDGSCYQYVYQRVLCYEEGLATGRVPL